MSKSVFSIGLGGAMALVATLVAPAAHADGIHYRYVAIDQANLPAPYTSFSPSTVIDGRVIGTVFDDTFSIAAVAVYDHGAIAIGPAGFASDGNHRGMIGGSNLNSQASIFSHGNTTVVPALPNALFSNVNALADDGLALISSTDSSFTATFAYFARGNVTPINFGLPDPVFGGFMNDEGMVAVTKEESATDHFLHGYRYNPLSQKSTLLPPFAGDPTDVMVLVQGMNDREEVLGYSFTTFDSTSYHERVGFWDRFNTFHPFFEETNNTQQLFSNDSDEIVITESSDGNSYLVPQPGTRLNLADIVKNVPAGLSLSQAVGIDNAGNIAGVANDATQTNFYPFLLVPIGDNDGAGPVHPCHGIPGAIIHAFQRQHHHK